MTNRVSTTCSPLLLSVVMMLSTCGIFAQSSLDQAITAKFPPTIATASLDDIVTPGAVMTLKVKGVLMFATTESLKAQLTYKDGKLTPGFTTQMATSNSVFHKSTVTQRTYVTNEKLWLIDVKDATDGVVLQMLSDAVNNIRYTTFIKFPFPKGGSPSPDEITGQIAQVMVPEGGAPPPPPPPPAEPQKHAPVVIPPPAPLADASPAALPTIEKGETKEEVISGYGPPTRVVKITSTKEIDYYKDKKVTYENGKVSKVE